MAVSLVYIASTGRSGSTLLELILNSIDGIWTMGEAFVLPWELKEQNRVCGCGREVNECEFWRRIRDELGGILNEKGEIARFRDSYHRDRFHPLEFLKILLGQRGENDPCISSFCVANGRLFDAVVKTAADVSGHEPRVLVDSSKNCYRLHWLSLCKDLDLRVVQVVRDPRGFVNACLKGECGGARRLRRIVRSSARYVIENGLFRRTMARLPVDKTLTIRYEDLAAQPQRETERVCEWLGVSPPPVLEYSFRSTENHGIAGNTMRYDDGGIVLDEQWRTTLSSRAQAIIGLIARRTAEQYMYSDWP